MSEKISQLPSAASVPDGALVPVVIGGVSQKATAAQLRGSGPAPELSLLFRTPIGELLAVSGDIAIKENSSLGTSPSAGARLLVQDSILVQSTLTLSGTYATLEDVAFNLAPSDVLTIVFAAPGGKVYVNSRTAAAIAALTGGQLVITNGSIVPVPSYASVAVVASTAERDLLPTAELRAKQLVLAADTGLWYQWSGSAWAVYTGFSGGGGGDGFSFTFSATTTDADPGNGLLRLSSATPSAVTSIYVDLLDSVGNTVTTWLDSLSSFSGAPKGRLRLQSQSDHTRWAIYALSSVTSATGYRKLVVSYVAGSNTLPLTTAADTFLSFDASTSPDILPVDCATTGNITLSGEQLIDGITTAGSRVLVWQQTTGSQNGIYVSGSGAWARAGDQDAASEFRPGVGILIAGGTTNGGLLAYMVTPGAITVGTTTVTYALTSPAPVTGTDDNKVAIALSGRLSYALLVNANVASAAAIAGTKVAPDFGSQTVKTTDGYIATGAASYMRFGLPALSGAGVASAASVGCIRLPRGGGDLATINGRDDTDAADVRIIQWISSGATINIGLSSVVSGLNAHVASGGVFTVLTGGNGRFQVSNTVISALIPTFGFDANVTAPIFSQQNIGTNGVTAQPMIVHAQDATGTTSTGGILGIRPGSGTSAGGELWLGTGAATKKLRINDTGLGFFNTAPAAQPTISGSRGGNAALADLLTKLASLGLIVDSTSA